MSSIHDYPPYPNHLVAAQQFDRFTLERLFAQAKEMEGISVSMDGCDLLRRRIIATLFYEPSTRTRLSFETAIMQLGGRVISTENAKEFSSAAKGETIEDTVRVIGKYAKAIIIRHHETGAVLKAARVSPVPIINAGDGVGQHPTQALLDLYTIQKCFGQIDGLTIAMVGDLANGRTVRSLCHMLSRFKVNKVYFVAPDVVAMKDDIKKHLTEHGVCFADQPDISQIVGETDVFYWTRIQKERFGDRVEDYELARGKYIADAAFAATLKSGAIIMHPLPRVDEIKTDLDPLPCAKYFEQAGNGVPVRMAILADMLKP